MRKITVSLSKGGTGKTTSAVNLSAGLARAGYNVLLIDTDTQGQCSRALGVQPKAGLAEFVAGEAEQEQAIIEAREKLSLLAGGRALAGLKRLIARQDFGGERTLSEGLAPLNDQYDYIILDAAPGWDPLSINVLFYSEEILAPVSLEVLTLQGLMEFIKGVESIQKYSDKLTFKYILPTFFDLRVKKSLEIVGQLYRYFGDKLCQPIRYNVRLSEAPGFGQTIFEFAPKSAGAEDYQKLTERILEDE